MSSPGQIAAEPKLNLHVRLDGNTVLVGNVYYVIRKRDETGRNEFKKVDCRYQYTGSFGNVYIDIGVKWFRIDCFDPVKEDGISGTIIHQTNDLMEFGVEYLPDTKRNGNLLETGNQGNK